MNFIKRLFGQPLSPQKALPVTPHKPTWREQRIDEASDFVATEIDLLRGADKEFATELLTSAHRILYRLESRSIRERKGSVTFGSSNAHRAFKLILCHHCVLLFNTDRIANSAMRALITNITDYDQQDTDSIFGGYELAIVVTKEFLPEAIAVTNQLWLDLAPELHKSPDSLQLATIVIMTSFDEARASVLRFFD